MIRKVGATKLKANVAIHSIIDWHMFSNVVRMKISWPISIMNDVLEIQDALGKQVAVRGNLYETYSLPILEAR